MSERDAIIGSSIALCALMALWTVVYAVDDLAVHADWFVFLYAGIFCSYALLSFFLLRFEKIPSALFTLCVTVAVLSALLFLLMNTTLSTDLYRYLWDGRLVLAGINPYTVTPLDTQLAIFRDGLFDSLWWKEQYTVYPPLAQLVFAVSYVAYAALGVVAAKIVLALPAVGLAAFFYRILPHAYWLLFILNPLLLFESFYGGHIDTWAAAAIVIGLIFYQKEQYRLSALSIAAATLFKLYPALLGILFIADLSRRKTVAAFSYGGILGGAIFLAYTPLIHDIPFLIERYSRWAVEMKFNGSIYLFLEWVMQKTAISPEYAAYASLILFVGCLICISRYSVDAHTIFIAVGAFLLVSSVVYPWYILPLIPLAFLSPPRYRDSLLILVIVASFAVGVMYLSELRTLPVSERESLLRAIAIIEYISIGGIALWQWLRLISTSQHHEK